MNRVAVVGLNNITALGLNKEKKFYKKIEYGILFYKNAEYSIKKFFDDFFIPKKD